MRAIGLAMVATALIMFFGALAYGHQENPYHYHEGTTQTFNGIVCKEENSARHIFDTWVDHGVGAAQTLYSEYEAMNICRVIIMKDGYFIKELASGEAETSNGILQNIVMYSISPTSEAAANDIIDYVVTWVEIGNGA